MSEIESLKRKNESNIPEHVAIIMDGNGRWAKNQGKMRLFGHKAGVGSVKRAVSFAASNGIKILTLFAFSSENWRRPEDEVRGLMELFSFALSNEVKNLHKNNIKLQIIGDISRFSGILQKMIRSAIELTSSNTGLILNIAVNYGGRWDINQSIKKIAQLYADKKITLDEVTESLVSENLAEPTDVDLLIRTGGEHRISNFLLWQSAYAEIYVVDELWPDFDEQVFQRAVDYYTSRERRFGCTGEQIRSENK